MRKKIGYNTVKKQIVELSEKDLKATIVKKKMCQWSIMHILETNEAESVSKK